MFKTQLAFENWKSKYSYNGEQPENTWRRVAKALASVEAEPEKWEDIFFRTMVKFHPETDEPCGLKCTTGGRITANAGTSFGGATLINCFSGDTKYITETGVKSLKDTVGSSQKIVSSGGQFIAGKVEFFGKQPLNKVVFRPCGVEIIYQNSKTGQLSNSEDVDAIEKVSFRPFRRSMYKEEIFTTLNHTWELVDGSTTDRLEIGDFIPSNSPNVDIDKGKYALGMKHGLIFGDGSVEYKYVDSTKIRYRIRLCGNKSKYAHLFDDVKEFESCDGDPVCIVITDKKLKELPVEFEVSYVKGFIDGYLAADGSILTQKSKQLTSVNKDALEWVKKHSIYAGYISFGINKDKVEDTNLGSRELYRLNMTEASSVVWKVDDIFGGICYDDVFCLNVPDTHRFTLGNGIFTSNCYINGPVTNATINYQRTSADGKHSYPIKIHTEGTPDNLHNIFLTVLEQAKTLAAEGGYGINFSFIRPRGSLIKSIGIKHPGVVSYMEIWDAVSECIVKGDTDGYKDKIKNHLNEEEIEQLKTIVKKSIRKGAMMGCLDVSHPDIEEFIRAKQESGKLTKFNMSVLVDDAFMKAVDANDYYDLKFGGIVYKRVKARELYNLMMESSYNRGEPGILFVDNMHRNNPVSYLGKANCTNPCVAPETNILTDEGNIPIATKENELVNVWNGREFSGVLVCRTSEEEELLKVSFSNGVELECTETHEFKIQEGFSRDGRQIDKKTIELKKGDKLIKYDLPILSSGIEVFEDAYTHGFFCADDTYHRDNPRVSLYAKKKQLVGVLSTRSGSGIDDAVGKQNYTSGDIAEKYEVPSASCRISDRLEWFAGYADGDGSINIDDTGNQSLQITSIKKDFLLKVRLMLQTIGVDSKVTLSHQAGKKNLSDGKGGYKEYDTQECYRLIVSSVGLWDLHRLGWVPHRLEYLPKKPNRNASQFIRVVSVERTGRRDATFCFTEPNRHMGMFNGILTGQCGEIPGIADLTTVCLLGSVNLTQYVCRNREFDFTTYEEDVMVFTRMLDNVNDLTNNPLPSYTWAMKNLRQIGMGLNGLGSALIMMGIPYNSSKAIKFVKRIGKIKENATWRASAMLAKEKGVFPAYDKEQFESTAYFKSSRISEETKEMLRKYGARNAKTTTNPPLGNSSVICDNVSNGIEPVFSLEYERIRIIHEWPEGLDKENVKDELRQYKKKDFEYWKGEYNGKVYYYEPHNRGLCEVSVIRDYGWAWVLENFPNEDHTEYAITTSKLKAEDHLEIQKVVQFYCNQSVSKTINLPKMYGFSNFKNLYMQAWKMSLNGLTTYREGSMEAVISSIETAEKSREIIKKDIKLPDTFINGPTSIIKREGMKFYIHFSYLPDDTEQNFPVCLWIYTNNREKGQTVACNKAAKKLAELAQQCGIDSRIIDSAVEKAKEDASFNKLGRMISLCLRHNIPRDQVYVAITGIEGDNISTLLTAVRHFISSTIKDGTHLDGVKCEGCTGDNVVMVSGCKQCRDCGYSACG